MKKSKKKGQNPNGEEMLDSKTGGDYVDFEVEDPDGDKPMGSQLKSTDKPLSERAADNHSRSYGKGKYIVKVPVQIN